MIKFLRAILVGVMIACWELGWDKLGDWIEHNLVVSADALEPETWAEIESARREAVERSDY